MTDAPGLPGACDLCPLGARKRNGENEWMGQRAPSWGRKQHRTEPETDSHEKKVFPPTGGERC